MNHKIFNITIRTWLTGLFGVISFATFFAPSLWIGDNFFEPYNISRILVTSLFIGLVLSYKPHVELKKSIDNAPKIAKILMILIPLVVLAIVIVQILAPDFAVWLIRCDSKDYCGINFRHGIFVKSFLEMVACVTFSILFVRSFSRKQWLQAVTFLLLAMVTFLMAGEELSWGQRIISFETPEDLKKINAQNEFNLHNIATDLFQNVWYFGSWILLVVMPFLRIPLEKFFSKSDKFAFLKNFLPPTYYILIFAAVFGFADPISSSTGLRWGALYFIVAGTFAILFKLVISARGRLAERICFVLGVLTVSLFSSLFISQVWYIVSGASTEYLELFLAFGIAMWSLYVYKNVNSDFKKNENIVEKSR